MQNHVLARLLMLAAAVASLGARHAAPRRSALRQLPALTPHDSALHALDRLAYGPRPGEVDAVAAGGVMNWIDGQLSPDQLDDRLVAERTTAFRILRYDPRDLARLYAAARNERREGRQGGKDEEMGRRLAGEVEQLAVVRAALSRRQLYEVMVDFWANHFNVFFGKGADRVLAPSYIEETLRPRAFGKFADLLIATARSPAMLFYLDNWESVAPGSAPPALTRPRLGARPWFGRGRYVPGFSREPAQADSQRQRVLERMPKGINENYARELLELHTLGVDGGYAQQDVIEVARIFTGWSIERPERGAGFVFHGWAHDRGTKHVFGMTFHDDGKDEGIRLLKFLAMQQATMHHVSAKLCARFVADEPPDGCIDAAVAAWQKSRGDIRAVLRAIFTSPEFWSAQAVRSKVKTPFEFVVSAVRATGVEPDDTPRLAQLVARLGEPLYQQPAPTGYAETEEHWVNSGALLARMNAAMGIAKDCSSVPANDDHARLIDMIDQQLLAGTMSAHTKSVILEQLTDVTDPVQARAMAVGLALGGPDFQKQ